LIPEEPKKFLAHLATKITGHAQVGPVMDLNNFGTNLFSSMRGIFFGNLEASYDLEASLPTWRKAARLLGRTLKLHKYLNYILFKNKTIFLLKVNNLWLRPSFTNLCLK